MQALVRGIAVLIVLVALVSGCGRVDVTRPAVPVQVDGAEMAGPDAPGADTEFPEDISSPPFHAP